MAAANADRFTLRVEDERFVLGPFVIHETYSGCDGHLVNEDNAQCNTGHAAFLYTQPIGGSSLQRPICSKCALKYMRTHALSE